MHPPARRIAAAGTSSSTLRAALPEVRLRTRSRRSPRSPAAASPSRSGRRACLAGRRRAGHRAGPISPEQTEATALAALPRGELAGGRGGQRRATRGVMVVGPTARRGAPVHGLRRGLLRRDRRAARRRAARARRGALDVLDAAGKRVARVGERRAARLRRRRPGRGRAAAGAGRPPPRTTGRCSRSTSRRAGSSTSRRAPRRTTCCSTCSRGSGPVPRCRCARSSPPGSRPPAGGGRAADGRERSGDGAVAVESTIAGRATVVVHGAGSEVARAAADVAAGRSAIALPEAPPEGDLTVTAEVLAGAGRWPAAASRCRRSAGCTRATRAGRSAAPTRSSPSPATSASPRAGAVAPADAALACRIRRGGRGRCVGGVIVTQRAEGRDIRLVGSGAAADPARVAHSGVRCGSPSSSPASTTRCSRTPAARPSRCSSGWAARSSSGAEQTCCGQMHGNSGYEDEAAALLERFARVFEGAEAVVSPSASCAGFVRERLRRRAAGPRAHAVPHRRARRRGRRRVVPAPGHAAPDLPLAARAPGRRRARSGCCARSAASTSSSSARRRSAAVSAGRSP